MLLTKFSHNRTTPKPTTTKPTTTAPTTAKPTASPTPGVVTQETPEPTPDPTTQIPTLEPTFGASPFVGAEDTISPTKGSTSNKKETGSNDSTNPNATTTQEVNSECREHHDQAWSGRESRMINACVNVCTVTTTKFEGNKLISTDVEKINGPCGAGQY